MTNKEAIPYLEYLSDLDFRKKYPKMPIVSMREQVEALKLAITALQELDKNPTKPNNSTDKVNNSTATQSNGIEGTEYGSGDATFLSVEELKRRIEPLPSVQTEACEYFALCRHGRDENKLRARFVFCEYCNDDTDGFVTPLEKNGHAFVRFGINGWELSLKANGWHGSAKIRYCPMCGRDLLVK